MNTEHTFGLRTKKSYNMIFKDIKRWRTLKMCNKYVPRRNCVREKTLHVPLWSAYQSTKGVTFVSTFSFRCFSNDKPESSMRPKCFCSFIFATGVPLNISCEWFGLDFLQDTTIDWQIISRSWFKTVADSIGSFTTEKSMVSSAKNLMLDLIFLSRSLM